MRKFAKVSLAILLVAVMAWASEPWKEKPYQQWDMKDTEKVMNDSPWARTIQVTMGIGFGNRMTPPNAGSQQGGQGQPNMPPGGEPRTVDDSNGMSSSMQRTSSFEVRWISALTMRQALSRASVLDGKMTQADVERYLAKPPATYQLALFGPNMSAFAGATEAALMKDSYLEMKSEKQKVAPISVNIEKSADGKSEAITFDFPKTENGQPTIGPDEKGIDFVCKVKDLNLKFHFDPRKMTGKQGRDL